MAGAALGALVTFAPAQSASWRIVDAKTDGEARIHELVSPPKIGTTYQVRTDRPYRGSHRGIPWVLLGASRTRYGSVALPIALDMQQMVGRRFEAIFGSLKCSPDIVLPSTGILQLAIPNDASLVGIRLYEQTLISVSGGSYSGYSSWTFSLGSLAEVTIGR